MIIKNQYARKSLYYWVKSLDDKNLEKVSVSLRDFDHGGICIENAYFIVKHEPSRALISFFCIDLDPKFVNKIKKHQATHNSFCEPYQIKITELLREEQ